MFKTKFANCDNVCFGSDSKLILNCISAFLIYSPLHVLNNNDWWKRLMLNKN